MTAQTIEVDHREVVCLFCGTHTPAPAPKAARKSVNRFASGNFRVSIVRCRACGKEAPYQVSGQDAYGEEAKAAGAGAD